MNRQQKEVVIDTLRKDFSSSGALYIVGFRGVTVDQLYNLRKEVRKHKGHVKVAKVRLAKRAIAGLPGTDELMPLLKDQVAIIFSDDESPAVAKVIYDFSKNNEKITVVGGFAASTVLAADTVKRIAQLPSREVLLGQLVGMIQAPIAQFSMLLKMVPQQLVSALKQIEEKKK